MKQNLIACVLFLFFGVLGVKSEPVILALHHEGNVTFYYDYQFDAAQEAAVDGDTIYLSEGTFDGTMWVRKPIHVIGGGQNTIINGYLVFVNDVYPDGFVVENLKVKRHVHPDQHASVGMRLRKVWAEGIEHYNTSITDGYFVSCYFEDVNLANMVNTSFVNCKIENVSSSASGNNAVLLMNCNINNPDGVDGASFMNCIMSGSFSGSATNCLLSIESELNTNNCWTYSTSLFDENLECNIPSDQMSQYIGTDGTVVGCYGGESPFSLNPTTPRILQKTVTLDKVAKKLNVNITVGTE